MQRDAIFEQHPSFQNVGSGHSYNNYRIFRCNEPKTFLSKAVQTCLSLQGVVDPTHTLRSHDLVVGTRIESSGRGSKSSMNRLELYQLLSHLDGPNTCTTSSLSLSFLSTSLKSEESKQRKRSGSLFDDERSGIDTTDDFDDSHSRGGMEVDDFTPLTFNPNSDSNGTILGKVDLRIWEDAMHGILYDDDAQGNPLPDDQRDTTSMEQKRANTTTLPIRDDEPSPPENHTPFASAIDTAAPMETIMNDAEREAKMPSMPSTVDQDDDDDDHHSCGSDRQGVLQYHSRRLRQFMVESSGTHDALQNWDRVRGLPASHSRTMVNSARSRRQLLEGVLLRKWNGKTLVQTPETVTTEDGETQSAASERKYEWTEQHQECYEWFYGTDG
jgi:hypothetical protein